MIIVPEQVTLAEEPLNIEPGGVAELLQFLVVESYIGIAIISDWSGSK